MAALVVSAAETAAALESGLPLQLIDARWFLSGMDAGQAFYRQHIKTARWFDIDRIAVPAHQCDNLPHMLPAADVFQEHLDHLRIDPTLPLRVYDHCGLYAAPRVWWSLKAMSVADVAVIAGGLPALREAGLEVVSAESPAQAVAAHAPVAHQYRYRLDRRRVIDKQELKSARSGFLILDARPVARFDGRAPEPRAVLRSGHIEGSVNLPFTRVLLDDGSDLRPGPELRQLLAASGLPGERPVVASCGSGVTAAILALAIESCGLGVVRVYDGSWAEWNVDLTCPVAS